jgi:hypothetical protein
MFSAEENIPFLSHREHPRRTNCHAVVCFEYNALRTDGPADRLNACFWQPSRPADLGWPRAQG